jgi:hypothetical protein
MTLNIVLRASASLAANTSATAINWDLTQKFEGLAQVSAAYPSSGSGEVRIRAYRVVNSTSSPTPDTVPAIDVTLPRTASTTVIRTIKLGTGMWQIIVTNQDTTNGMAVAVIGATLDSVA